MEEFKKCKRDAKLLLADEWRNWRLASVDEVNNNVTKIKGMENLRSWNTVRLLDGCMEKYKGLKQYRPDMEDMLLVKTEISRPEDGSFDPDMYSGVELHAQGGEVALRLSCEDKITEAICLVLSIIVKQEVYIENLTTSPNKNTNSSAKSPDKNTNSSAKSPSKNIKRDIDSLTKILKEKFDTGRKILQCAVEQQHNQKHPMEVAKFVMEIFKDEEELLKDPDIYGRTVLHWAALRGYVDLCQLLIEDWKMRVDEKDINKEHVLHFAVKGKKKDVVDYLCGLPEVQSIIGSPDAQGKTALHKAAAQGAEQMITTLLSKISMSKEKETYISEANLLFIRQPDMFGQTALLEAARGGHVEAVKLLLKEGSRPLHERNSDGRSALHYAVQLSNDQKPEEMVESLLNKCSSDVERSLLLWAYAIGSGTAEACAKTPQVRDYLKTERERIDGSSEDLLSSAIELGHEKMGWELVNRGANTAHIRNGKWSGDGKRRVDNLHKQIGNIHKMPERGRDQPAIYDSLERKEFAQGLAALFLNPYVKSPLTVGIFGDWGMGKSSLMIQTEIILLKTAAQLAFPNLLETEQFPGCRQIKLSSKGRQKYQKINKAVKNLLPSSPSKDDPLLEFLDRDYQEKYHNVYKSLALIDRNEMFETKDDDEAADSGSNQYALRKIPSILTVRYNAWQYQDESEAWAGLAVEITKAVEESMTTAQRVRCHCRYAWRQQRNKIWLELFLPCLFALFLSGWIAWVIWKLVSRSKNNELVQLTYGSIPITILVAVWTVMKQFLSVIKPISAQVMGYFSKTDHSTKLGYQHQVIFDINFLMEEIGEKPSCIWKFSGWLCNLLHLYPDYSDTVKFTSISKSPAPCKDDIRMIVFVDDLDRCDDTVILKVLSAVNLVLATCNINVILGMDEKMIARAMKLQFPDSKDEEELKELAKKYISKIVQLPLALPDTSEDETMKFLHEQLGQAFEESESKVPKEGRTEESACENQSLSGQSRDHVSLDVSHNLPQNRHNFLSKLCGIFKPFWGFKNCLLIQDPEETKEKLEKSKLETMSLNLQMIMPNYTYEERKALDWLSKEATGAQKLPREWKRFLIYHRVAWNILSQSEQVKGTPGWQMQLVVWVFCCWQWEHQINDIIKYWKKLVLVNSSFKDGEDCLELTYPSLKSIVENCYQKIWLPHHRKEQEEQKQKQQEQKQKKQKDPGKEDEDDEKDEELELKNEKEKKEAEDWDSLKKTLDTNTYDVSMEGILSFQKFRLHCKIGHLSLSTNNLNRKDKGMYI